MRRATAAQVIIDDLLPPATDLGHPFPGCCGHVAQSKGQHGAGGSLACDVLLAGDIIEFEAHLEALITSTLSYHDVAGRRPEAVYQAFVLGLLVRLDATHLVQSNREAGHGRVDVLISPRRAGDVGVVLELKVIDERRGETAEAALAAALRQVVERDYAATLRERGAGAVHQLGAVFDGKRAWVAAAGEARAPRRPRR